jgi:hypothetical protein
MGDFVGHHRLSIASFDANRGANITALEYGMNVNLAKRFGAKPDLHFCTTGLLCETRGTHGPLDRRLVARGKTRASGFSAALRRSLALKSRAPCLSGRLGTELRQIG